MKIRNILPKTIVFICNPTGDEIIAMRIIISKSKITNIILSIKKFRENGSRLILYLSKPHSYLKYSLKSFLRINLRVKSIRQQIRILRRVKKIKVIIREA